MDPTYIAGLVSVIIPTYNRAHLVEHTLNSVLRQSYRPIELLVVDDGSSDRTAEFVEQWSRSHRDERLQLVLVRQANAGAPSARNHGLRLSRGEFIQFLDSDDALASEKIQSQVRALQQSGADVASSGVRFVDDHGKVEQAEPTSVDRVFLPSAEVPAIISRCLLRRQACLAIGPWNEALIRHQDWEYSVRAANLDLSVVASEDPLYIYVAHPGERIDDIDKDPGRVLQGYFAAIDSAERATAANLRETARESLGRKSASALLAALILDDLASARLAMSKIRAHLSLRDRARLKAEALMFITAIWRPLAVQLSKKVLLSHENSRAQARFR